MQNSENRTKATDVWAFACLALEIITGHIPFYHLETDARVIQEIIKGTIPARKDYAELPDDNKFWGVLEACWKTEPLERPSMTALALDIFNDNIFSLNHD
ncbi:hypothetical protein FRB95_005775 [Tulasnella sp. JGI-2019a]|nr:hypothetical protein FRB95_005775 [Tulasnella sp. JGI-2019a]